jgi:TetR/AcrR family transcriptional regulator, mexCD-oprJ operon repressor
MAQTTSDHRRATAERNLRAILDAAERLLERSAQVSIAAVATESGVSRVTVYAHFATLEQLLEAVVERAVRHAAAALDAAELDSGAPVDALERVITISWRELDRHQSTARAAAEQLGPDRLHHAHRTVRKPLRRLADRGRRQGAFRTDVSADWLVTGCIALMHAAVDEVRSKRMSASAAQKALMATVHDLWVARTDVPTSVRTS